MQAYNDSSNLIQAGTRAVRRCQSVHSYMLSSQSVLNMADWHAPKSMLPEALWISSNMF